MLGEFFEFIIAIKWALTSIIGLTIFRKPLIELITRIKAVKVKTLAGVEGSIETFTRSTKEIQGTSEKNLELPAEVTLASEETRIENLEEDAEDWVGKIIQALESNNVSEAKEIFRASIDDQTKSSSKSWMEGWFFNRLFTKANDQSALSDLIDRLLQSTEYNIRKDYLWWAIISLEEIKDYSQIIDLLKRELLQGDDKIYRDYVTVKLSQVLVKTHQEDKALLLLIDRLNEILKDDERALIYRAIADVEKAQNNEKMEALCLEKNAQLNPTDSSILFQAAYAESDAGFDILAYSNYDTVLALSPNDNMALNNMAVQYAEFSLPVKSVELYKKAAEAGNTLAMSNLAYRMIDSGFISEAEEILKKAIGAEEPDESVFEAMSKIPAKRAHEDKEINKLKEKSLRYREHLRNYTEAYYLRAKGNVFAGLWKDQYGRTFTISPDSNRIQVEWESNSPSNMGVICKLSGSIVNSSGILNYSTKPVNQAEALSYYMQLLNKSYECYAYLSSNRNVINLISLNSTTDFFVTLSRVRK